MTDQWLFDGGSVSDEATGDTVALVITLKHAGDNEDALLARHKRNGVLIAAAPDLLAALYEISASAEEDPSVVGAPDWVVEVYARHFEAANIARAAIAKARGTDNA